MKGFFFGGADRSDVVEIYTDGNIIGYKEIYYDDEGNRIVDKTEKELTFDSLSNFSKNIISELESCVGSRLVEYKKGHSLLEKLGRKNDK